MLLVCLALLGCENEVQRTQLAQPVELDASLVAPRVEPGEPLVLRACVRVREPGWSWAPSFPAVEGLEPGEITSQVKGEVSCLEQAYSGEPGGYVFAPVQIQASGPDAASLELAGPRLFGDIGDPAVSSDLGALQSQPDRRWIKRDVPWIKILVPVALAILAGLGGLWWMQRPGQEQGALEPELPPGARALRDWDQARGDPALSDQEKGQALSRITRRYLTEVGAPQALTRTTDELLRELEGHARLGEWRGVLEHLLSAADTVKFAGGSASAALLEQWSEGLRSLVQAHQPPPKAEQI